MTVIVLIPMALQSKGMGAQEMQEGTDILTCIAQRKASVKRLTLPRSFERKLGKLSTSNPTSARNVVLKNTKVTVSLMTAHDRGDTTQNGQK